MTNNNTFYSIRDSFWQKIGDLDPDALVPMVNTAFDDQPSWPDIRQSFRFIDLEEGSTIIATDGLSDAFSDNHPHKKDTCGFELELFMRIDENEIEDGDQWPIEIVLQASLQVADNGNIAALLNKHTYLTTELYNVSLPEEYLQEDRVGVMIGLPSKLVPPKIDLQTGSAATVSLTLLTLDELQYASQGAQARKEVAEKLLELFDGEPISTLNRKSVV